MLRSIRRTVGEQIDHVTYSLLRMTVTRLVPAVVQFDEGDPLLLAGSTRERHPG
jgi:hypothetical protein